MESPSYHDQSRTRWCSTQTPLSEQVKLGALQRIADATEKMASSYDALQRDRDYWKSRATEHESEVKRLALCIRSLRGVITRMRRSGK